MAGCIDMASEGACNYNQVCCHSLTLLHLRKVFVLHHRRSKDCEWFIIFVFDAYSSNSGVSISVNFCFKGWWVIVVGVVTEGNPPPNFQRNYQQR